VEDPDAGVLKDVVPGPDTWLHNPVPFTGVLPPSEPVTNVPQKLIGEVFMIAVVGVAWKFTVTCDELGVQVPLLMVN
jgi:hypothetical protein